MQNHFWIDDWQVKNGSFSRDIDCSLCIINMGIWNYMVRILSRVSQAGRNIEYYYKNSVVTKIGTNVA